MRHGLGRLAIAAALAAGAPSVAMAQSACPAGYAYSGGVCQPYAYAPSNPVSGAAAGGAAGPAARGAAGWPVGAVVGGSVASAPRSEPPGAPCPNGTSTPSPPPATLTAR